MYVIGFYFRMQLTYIISSGQVSLCHCAASVVRPTSTFSFLLKNH